MRVLINSWYYLVKLRKNKGILKSFKKKIFVIIIFKNWKNGLYFKFRIYIFCFEEILKY